MKIVQETTQWADAVVNNLYLVSDNMEYIIAYVPKGDKAAHRFKKPIRWDSKGRTFRILKEIKENNSNTVNIVGSKGQAYTLSRLNTRWQCTCPGFQFRGNCRHAAAKMSNLS